MECKLNRGSSLNEISDVTEKLTVEMGINVQKEKFQQLKTSQIAYKLVNDMGHNLPNILRTIYQLDRVRAKDESEEALEVLKAFELRKIDTKYYSMLEKKKNEKEIRAKIIAK